MLVVASVAGCGLALLQAFSRRNWPIPAAVGLYVIVMFGGEIYSSMLQRFAVTPDELGDGWEDGRVCLDLVVEWNGRPFGRANGREMACGFHDLVAHAAATRDLVAGTIIGSGTVANADHAEVGSSCISERRAIEIIAGGEPTTRFMRFGDRCRMQGTAADGRAVFGTIEQEVVAAAGHAT